MSQISENTEVTTFGNVMVTPLADAENRQDIREIRLLMSAVLDRLHLTLGHTEGNQIGQNLVSAAIPQVLATTDFVVRALAFSDEVAMTNPEAVEEETSWVRLPDIPQDGCDNRTKFHKTGCSGYVPSGPD